MAVKASRLSSDAPPLGETQLQAVADLFAVLSEPTRLRILQFLERGPASVSDVIEQLGIKQANASKQLGILLRAGVLGREQRGLHAVYSIRMRLVFELCALVCGRLKEEAVTYAKQMKG